MAANPRNVGLGKAPNHEIEAIIVRLKHTNSQNHFKDVLQQSSQLVLDKLVLHDDFYLTITSAQREIFKEVLEKKREENHQNNLKKVIANADNAVLMTPSEIKKLKDDSFRNGATAIGAAAGGLVGVGGSCCAGFGIVGVFFTAMGGILAGGVAGRTYGNYIIAKETATKAPDVTLAKPVLVLAATVS